MKTHSQISKTNSLILGTAEGSILKAEFIENPKVYEILRAV